MMSVRYHVVVAFGVAADGTLAPVVEEAAANPQVAVLLARRFGRTYAGAVAFSRTMDVGRGRYGPAKVHAVEGQIPSDLQPMCGQGPSLKPPVQSERPARMAPTFRSKAQPVSVVVRPARWRR